MIFVILLLAYFWHVTDFHLDVNFTVAPDSIYEANDYFIGNYSYETCWGNASGIFGDYNCDASENLVISAIDFVKTHSENVLNPEDVSFVLWTGYVSMLPKTMLIFKWTSEINIYDIYDFFGKLSLLDLLFLDCIFWKGISGNTVYKEFFYYFSFQKRES